MKGVVKGRSSITLTDSRRRAKKEEEEEEEKVRGTYQHQLQIGWWIARWKRSGE